MRGPERKMTAPTTPPRLVVITHPALGDDLLVSRVGELAAALPPGALALQLRDKKREQASLQALARRLRDVTASAGALLVVNGDAEVARDVEADGVHLGGGAI